MNIVTEIKKQNKMTAVEEKGDMKEQNERQLPTKIANTVFARL